MVKFSFLLCLRVSARRPQAGPAPQLLLRTIPETNSSSISFAGFAKEPVHREVGAPVFRPAWVSGLPKAARGRLTQSRLQTGAPKPTASQCTGKKRGVIRSACGARSTRNQRQACCRLLPVRRAGRDHESQKGFRDGAQGCRVREATLGGRSLLVTQPRRGCALTRRRWVATPLGLIRVSQVTQDRLADSPTLGWVTESLGDSPMRSIVSSLVHRQSVDARPTARWRKCGW